MHLLFLTLVGCPLPEIKVRNLHILITAAEAVGLQKKYETRPHFKNWLAHVFAQAGKEKASLQQQKRK